LLTIFGSPIKPAPRLRLRIERVRTILKE